MGGRLRDIDPTGRRGLYTRVALSLIDLDRGQPLPGNVTLLAAGNDLWMLLPNDELLWVDFSPLNKHIAQHVFLRVEADGTRKQVAMLPGERELDVWPRALQRSEHGRYALVLRSDEVVDVIDTQRRAFHAALRVPGQVLQTAAVSEAAGLVVAASFGKLFVFGLADGKLRGTRTLPDGDVLWLDCAASIVGVAVEGGGLTLLPIGGHPRSWQPLPAGARALGSGISTRVGAALSPDGRLFARGRGSVVELWTLQGGVPRLLQTLRVHTDGVHFVRFTADGSRLITADRDNRIVIWPRSGDRVQTLEDAREGLGLR